MEIQGMLDSMIDGVKDINDWLLTAKEIDHLARQVTDKKGGIKSSFSFQLRKNLNDFKNMRRTRSHRDMAQGWRGTDSIAREGPEQNPEMKSIIKQYGDEYSDINETLFQRLQICVNRSNAEEKENPLNVLNLCFSFRNAIDNLNLETKYEAALYRYFASKVLSELAPQYRKIDDLLAKQGILLDSVSADSAPGDARDTDSKANPVPKEFKAKSKSSENLSEQKPPESITISRSSELLSLLHEHKNNTQFASSRLNNIFPDLKEKLSTLKISDIDKELELVSILFNFVFSNKELPDEIKAQLGRLQIYFLMSAINETGFLTQSSNPAHLLLDTVVENEVELVDTGRSGQTGNQVLTRGIDQLIDSQNVTFKSYSEILKQYQNHIDGLKQKIRDEELKDKFDEENRLKEVKEADRLKEAKEAERLKKAEDAERLKKIDEDRLKKIADEQRLKKAEEEERLKKIEEDRLKKIVDEQRLKKTKEEERLKKIEEVRLKKIADEQRLKKTKEEERLKKIEEIRLKKITDEQRSKKTEEEERLKKIEEVRLKKIEKERLKRIEEETRLKRIDEDNRLKKIKQQERLKQAREEALKKQKHEKELKLKVDQTVRMKRLVKSTIEEITIPLLALNKPFILYDKVWSPLLLQIALTDGIKSSIWEKTLRMVRSQVWSIIPKSTKGDLQKLITIRPHISNSLVRGMRSLKLSSSLQKSLVEFIRLEYEEVIKQSKQKIKTARKNKSAKLTKQPPRQNTVAVKPIHPDNKKLAAKSVVSNDDSEFTFIHDSKDLRFYDAENAGTHDSEDLVIDDSDDLVTDDSDNLVINDSEDTIIEGSEDMIIEDIEDFSASMETGIYQLSSEMLQALNSVKPGDNKSKTGDTEADKIKKGDWAEIKQGSTKIMAKLTWRAADSSLFIFVDDSGKRIKEIDGTTLNGEIQSGSMKLIKSSSLASTSCRFSVISRPKK